MSYGILFVLADWGRPHRSVLPRGPCAMQTDGESETRVWKSMDVEAVLAACLDSARDRSQHNSVRLNSRTVLLLRISSLDNGTLRRRTSNGIASHVVCCMLHYVCCMLHTSHDARILCMLLCMLHVRYSASYVASWCCSAS
jgi:hypothetical protein